MGDALFRAAVPFEPSGEPRRNPLVTDPTRASQGIFSSALSYDEDTPPRPQRAQEAVFRYQEQRKVGQLRQLLDLAESLSPDAKEAERAKILTSWYVADKKGEDPRSVYLAWAGDKNRYVEDYFESSQRPSTYIGYMKNELNRSLIQYRLLNMGTALLASGTPDPARYHEYLEVARSLPPQKRTRDMGIWGFIAKDVPEAAIQALPSMADMSIASALGAGIGGLGGAIVGSFAGPEAIPPAAAAGSRIMRSIFGFASSARLNASGVFADIMTMRDETTGQYLYEEVNAEQASKVALYSSIVAGGFMGALDLLSFETSVGRPLLDRIGKKAFAKAGMSGAIRGHFKAFMAQYGLGVGTETFTEGAQDLLGALAKNAQAEALNERGGDYPVANWRDLAKLAVQSGSLAAKSALLYSLPGAVVESRQALEASAAESKVQAAKDELAALSRVEDKSLAIVERARSLETMQAQTAKALATAEEKLNKAAKFDAAAATEVYRQEAKARYLELRRREIEADNPDLPWKYSVDEWTRRARALPAPGPAIAFESPVVEKIKKGLPALSDEQAQGAALYAKLHADTLGVSLEDYMGSRFVSDIFDPSLAEQLQAEGRRGSINWNAAGQAIFYTTTHSDFGTWVHELEHLFTQELTASEREVADRFVGAVGGQPWTREQHERLAEGALGYILNGLSPSDDLKPIFERFQGWLNDIYGSVKDRWPVTDDIRMVQDMLLSGRRAHESPAAVAAVPPGTFATSENATEIVPFSAVAGRAQIREQVLAPETAPPEPGPTVSEAPGILPVWVNVADLALSREVPNFKEGADVKTGVVEELAGTYVHEGTGALLVWRRLDGRLEVISGRHRLDLARRSGEKLIQAQVFEEAEGFTAAEAAMKDAEANIRDQQGSVGDYAAYFRHTDITEQQASRRGLLGRDKGRKGWAIGKYASDGLYAAFRNGRIAEAKAAAIAAAAPNNEGLQAAGIAEAARDHASTPEALATFVELLAVRQGIDARQAAADQQELPGMERDEKFLRDAAALGKEKAKKLSELTTEFSTLRSAVRLSSGDRAKMVEQYGLKGADVLAIQARLDKLEDEIAGWQDKGWMTDPAKMRELEQRMGREMPLFNELRSEAAKDVVEEERFKDTESGMLFQPDPHAQAVIDAIARGLPVPAARLAEYSELPEVKAEIERREFLMGLSDQVTSEDDFLDWMLRAEGDKPATEAYYRMLYRAAQGRQRDPAVVEAKFRAALTPEVVRGVMQAIVLIEQDGDNPKIASLTPEMRKLGEEALKGEQTEGLAEQVVAQIAQDPAGWREKLVEYLPTAPDGEAAYQEVADTIREAEAEAVQPELFGEDLAKRRLNEIEQELIDRQADLALARRQLKEAMQKYNNARQAAREGATAAKEAQQEAQQAQQQTERMQAGAEKLSNLVAELHAARQREKAAARKARDAKRRAEEVRKLGRRIQRPVGRSIAYAEAMQILDIQARVAPMPADVERGVLSRIREFRRQNPQEPLPSSLVQAIERRDPRTMTYGELKAVSDEVDELRTRGREKRAREIETERGFLALYRGMIGGGGPSGRLPPGGGGTEALRRRAETPAPAKFFLHTWRMNRIAPIIDDRIGVTNIGEALPEDLLQQLSDEIGVSKETLRQVGPTQAWLWEAINVAVDEKERGSRRIANLEAAKLRELGLTPQMLGKTREFDGWKYSRGEMMGVYIYSQNEDTLQAIVTMERGLEPKTVEKIVAALTSQEKAYADWLVDFTSSDAEFDRLTEARLAFDGQVLDRLEHYFPIHRRGPGSNSFLSEVITEMLAMRGYARRVARPGFFKPRLEVTPGMPQVRLDAPAVFAAHWQQREWFISHARLLKRLFRIFASRDVRATLTEKFGTTMPQIVSEYLGAATNPNIYRAAESWDDLTRLMRGNLAFAVLGGNVLTILRQLPDIPQIMVQVGHPIWAIRAAAELATNPRAALEKVFSKAPQLQQRSYDRFIEELRNLDNTAYERARNRVGEAAFLALKTLDNVTNAIGFLAVYNKTMAESGNELYATETARDFILRTRPAARGKDLASLYRSRGLGWFLLFGNQQNQQWNVLTADVYLGLRRAARGDWSQLIKATTEVVGIAVGAIGMTMLAGKKLPEEPEDWVNGLMASLFGNVPLVGNYIEDGLRGEVQRRGLNPFGDVYYVGRLIEGITSGDDMERVTRDAMHAMIGVSQLFGMPVVQLKRFWRAAETGDWWWVVGGPPKE